MRCYYIWRKPEGYEIEFYDFRRDCWCDYLLADCVSLNRELSVKIAEKHSAKVSEYDPHK